jgi:hypothetical protein
MGAERDVPEDLKKNKVLHFWDEEVDKLWLAGFSPHRALEGTKSDIGEPPGRQENDCRNEWEALSQEDKDKYGYEYDLMRELERLVQEADRKIARTKERVEESNPLEKLPSEVADQIRMMETQIQELQAESGRLGEEGDVDQSLTLHNEASDIQKKRAELLKQSVNPNEKQQFVCEVSGLIYSSTDNDQRIRDLQSGRQYLGWKKIRDHLVKLKGKNPKRGIPGYAESKASGDDDERVDKPRERDLEERDRDRERDRYDRGDRRDRRDRYDDRDRRNRYDDRDRRRDDRRDERRSDDRRYR